MNWKNTQAALENGLHFEVSSFVLESAAAFPYKFDNFKNCEFFGAPYFEAVTAWRIENTKSLFTLHRHSILLFF